MCDVVLDRVRQDSVVDEAADRVLQQPLLVGQLEVHAVSLSVVDRPAVLDVEVEDRGAFVAVKTADERNTALHEVLVGPGEDGPFVETDPLHVLSQRGVDNALETCPSDRAETHGARFAETKSSCPWRLSVSRKASAAMIAT